VLAWVVTSSILVGYSLLFGTIVPSTNFFREFLICGGQVAFQGLIVMFVSDGRPTRYLVNMMTVSLMGALLLTPMLVIGSWINSEIFFLLYFFMVVGWMFLEHMRRVKILRLPFYISATWVLYRLIVLFIIL
jgi:hypothetical protein